MPPVKPGVYSFLRRSRLLPRSPETLVLERWYLVPEDDDKIIITPAWLNYKQAEAYSNLSRTTLWQLINARKIRAARVGRAVRIERASLQRFMEQSTEDLGVL
jgi:excisionase family DNA binding protein